MKWHQAPRPSPIERVPIVRIDEDGTTIDGTAAMRRDGRGGFNLSDFRDLDGNELILPPRSQFRIPLDDDDVQRALRERFGAP